MREPRRSAPIRAASRQPASWDGPQRAWARRSAEADAHGVPAHRNPPRIFPAPLPADVAVQHDEDWLAARAAWVPLPTSRHDEILLPLLRRVRITGPLVSDAHLAALALEQGVAIWSTDADFARSHGLVWATRLAEQIRPYVLVVGVAVGRVPRAEQRGDRAGTAAAGPASRHRPQRREMAP